VNDLQVLRPYGGLGPLPWQGSNPVPFGVQNGDLSAIARNIRTFTEPAAAVHNHDTIKSALKQAWTVVILGYGFHQQNNQLLRIGYEYQGSNQKHCFATVYNLNGLNHPTIENDLKIGLGMHSPENPPQLVNMKSRGLLSELGPTLLSLMSRANL
jgi:hypothetical protein